MQQIELIETDGVISVFAGADDEFFFVGGGGDDVDLDFALFGRIVAPPLTDGSGDEGEVFRVVEQIFPAHGFKDQTHIAREIVFDRRIIQAANPPGADRGDVLRDKAIPEAEEIVCQQVDRLLAGFFRDGGFPLDDAEVDQRLQIF